MNKITSSYSKSLPENEFTVNARILAKQDDLVKALAWSADVSEKKLKCRDNGIDLTGRINVKILCLDRENQAVSLNYNVDFDESLAFDGIASDSMVSVEISVEEMNVRLLDGREAEIIIRCKVLGEERLEQLTETDIPTENIFTKTESIAVGRIAAESEKSFTVTHEMPLQKGETLLQTDAKVVLTETLLKEGVLTVSGRLYLQSIYSSEEGLPKVTMVPIAFTEELEAPADKATQVRLNVESTRVRIIEEEDSSFINAEFTLKASMISFDEQQVTECVKDCYSLKYELKTTEAEITGTIYKGTTAAQMGFSGSITCDQPVARALGVFDSRAVISQASAGEASVQISGMVTGSFIYLDADDNIDSRAFALPFAVLVSLPDCDRTSKITVDAVVTDAAVKRNGAGADIAGTISASVYVTQNKTDRIVSNVILGEEKQPSSAAIEAVIAEAGDDAWTVGKMLNMSSDEITELNPELTSPLTKPAKVVVYHKL